MEEAIRKADALVEALPYIQQFADRPVVIKFGGNAMTDPQIVDDVVEDIVFLATVGIRAVVVHGGGPHVSQAMEAAGLVPRFVEGLRVTDAAALEVVVRVLSEDVNADILARIRKHGGEATPGFRDGRSILTCRRKTVRVTDADGAEREADLGFVGDVIAVDTGPLLSATARRGIVVVPPIGQDSSGQLYNVNADTAAASIAAGLQAEKVVFLSNTHGITMEPGNDDTLIESVTEAQVKELVADGIISGGMLPKVQACISALDGGVRKAHIIDGRLPHSLLLEIFTRKGVGTEIVR
jgi:acetylglutamate kinase